MIISVNVDDKSIVYGDKDNLVVDSTELSLENIDKRLSSINSEFIAENECVSFKVISVDDDSYISGIQILNVKTVNINDKGSSINNSDTSYALKTKCVSGECSTRCFKLEANIVNGGTGYSVGEEISFGYTKWVVDKIDDSSGSIISMSSTEMPFIDVSQTNVVGVVEGDSAGTDAIIDIMTTPVDTPTTDGPVIHVTYTQTRQSILNVQISSLENNGLSFTSDNKITATRGKDGNTGSGGTTNRAGNGIHCNERHEPVSILRCDLSCTSRVDPVDNDLSGRINFQTAVVDHLR